MVALQISNGVGTVEKCISLARLGVTDGTRLLRRAPEGQTWLSPNRRGSEGGCGAACV